MPIEVKRYLCSLCGTEYTNKEKALECESRTIVSKPDLKLGSIVNVRSQQSGEGLPYVENELEVEFIGYRLAVQNNVHIPVFIGRQYEVELDNPDTKVPKYLLEFIYLDGFYASGFESTFILDYEKHLRSLPSLYFEKDYEG